MARRSSTSRRASRQPILSVGLGSWADAEYTGLLYPEDLPANQRLEAYAQRFGHVEINSTYYRTPSRASVADWVQRTPVHFRFDVKLHRAFSDMPEKTAGQTDFVARWLDAAEPLITTQKLGAFLLVLPPGFGPKRRRLEELDLLAEKFTPHLLAVELRHRDWLAGDQATRTLDYFRTRKLVWVAVDMPPIEGSTLMPPVDEVTNPRLAYLRLHGRNLKWLEAKSAAERHTYAYRLSELRTIATRVHALATKADEVHVVANNHAKDFAPKTALALKKLLG